jgi:hypothetical protein
LENTPPPPGRGGISANVIWGKNMKRVNRKKRKMGRKKEKRLKINWKLKLKWENNCKREK